MQRQKAAEIIGYSRRRAKAIGCMIWPITLIIGFAGWYLWKWYALPISLVVAALFGSIYSIIEVRRLQKITGLHIHEQEMAFRESAAASLDPITRDPEQYRSHINSLPDDESDE
ncbi:MAG: hypothetical protein V3W14_06850 [Candidatus Neomarinimicrobiota bacterium]